MGKYLVTGRAGSGKTTVTRELTHRGLLAFDSDDVPGLSSWHDISTNQPVKVEDNSFVDFDKLKWLWNAQKVQELLTKYHDFFLCGGADNDLRFAPLFDKNFVLEVEPEIQIERIKSRTNNEYGQDPRMFPHIIEQQRTHLAAALGGGAVHINANLPIEQVVDEILSYVHDDSK